MKRAIIITTVLVAVVALAAIPAFAQKGNGRGQRGGGMGMGPGPGMGMGMGPGMGVGLLLRFPEMAEQAGVTDEQLEKLEDVMQKHQHEMIDTRDAMQDAKDDLDDLLKADTLDESAINKATQNLADAHAKMLKQRTSHMIEIRNIFSAAQLKKIDELAQDNRQMRRNNRRQRIRSTVTDPWQ